MNESDPQENAQIAGDVQLSEEQERKQRRTETTDETLVQSPEEQARAASLSKDRQVLPAKVPGYLLIRSLGEGSYGSVWLAQEENTGKFVAIKFYTYRRGLDWSLLNREVEKLAELYTSRHIISLQGVGWNSDPPYYMMEYLENGSLSAFLEDGPLPVSEAVRIAKTVLLALVHAHGRGILHCDLKPANILLDANFEPRICDFGQSRLTDEQSPSLGTLYYMAPEQADLQAVPDSRWDVYALGALLYHMLSGRAPYRTAENEQTIRSLNTLDEKLTAYRDLIRNSPRPAEHRKVSGVDRRLVDIVDRCLETDPQKRFPNAQAVLTSLVEREQQRARRPLIALGIIAPLLLVIGLIPVAGAAVNQMVSQFRNNLTQRALKGDSISANFLSQYMERDLQDRKDQLVDLSERTLLRSLMQGEEVNGEIIHRYPELFAYLMQEKTLIDEKRAALDRELDTSWFLTDEKGTQIWRDPGGPTIGQDFSYRDYFHGHGIEYDKDEIPEGIEPIKEPYICQVFKSDATHQWMVAIAVPVWDLKREKVLGVLSRTTHLAQLLSGFDESLSGDSENLGDRKIALIDSRDGKMLAHPRMTSDTLKSLSRDKVDQLVLADADFEQIRLIEHHQKKDQPKCVPAMVDDYRDPVEAVLSENSKDNVWLAAFSPIGTTGWTAVVQERRSMALKPVAEMRNWLIQYGFIVLVTSCLLIFTVWYFVMRVLTERRVRDWSRHRSDKRSEQGSTTSSWPDQQQS
ncbi:serine/threonine protein kinase [Gimesia sp.]|uniref:serine/threonine protein kinase n=1 Tax=Gimesia sp. TaxID=2024833 RepID=UPI000C590E70|nr:serine/threonine protein kinase [Gimesia sp.]MAX40586.1 serine/threonine protein kinase [Gimesia sp.]|tara:strand:+ start:26130 stop:28364 length:2235 start_codon:yes stop_codon:yes gene_type:complete